MLQLTFIAYVVFVIAATLVPDAGTSMTVSNDKLAHLAAYFLMGIFAWISVTTMKRRLYLLFFSIFLGVALEGVQAFVPGRFMDAVDLAANTAGVVLAFIVCWLCALYVGRGTFGDKNAGGSPAGDTE